MAEPILPDIVLKYAEDAAFLWTLYDQVLLQPDAFADVGEVQLAQLVERLEASIDGVRVAGKDGVAIAEDRYAENRGAGELFLLRMLSSPETIAVRTLDLDRVRAYLAANLRTR